MTKQDDLGFTFNSRKNGDVEIRHRGRFCTKFSNTRGNRITSELENLDFAGQQQLMARLTGNYKRGNERVAKKR